MVRIPVYDYDRNLSPGTEFKLPFGGSAESDVKAGTSGLGQGLEHLGDVLNRRSDRDDKFAAENTLLQLDQQTSRKIDEATDRIPENGQGAKGFHDRVMADIGLDVDKALASMPDSQKQAMEVRLQQHLNQVSNTAAKLEIDKSRTFISSVVQGKLAQISNNVKSGVWNNEQSTAEIDRFLDGSGLPPEKLDFFRQNMVRAAESSRLEKLRTDNPEAFWREAEKYLPNAPGPAANDIHKIIINTARTYGVDPQTMLIVGQLESGFNPKAGGHGTIKGLFQMTASERKRLGNQLGLPEEAMLDPAGQSAGMAILYKEAQTRLEANGLAATPTNVWAHHLLGPGGILAFAKADPSADAYTVYRSVAGPSIANQAFRNNGGILVPGMTVGQVMGAIDSRVNRAARSVSGLVQAEPTNDPNAAQGAPLEIMGEKFREMGASDLMPQGEKAKATLVERNAQLMHAYASKTLAAPASAPNPYDATWRKAQDDGATQRGGGSKMLQGDASEFAFWSNYAQQNGYLPKSVTAAGLNMINSKDEAQKLKGYELLSKVAVHNPTDGLRLSGVGGDADAEGANNAAKVRDWVALTKHGGFSSKDAPDGVDPLKLEAMRRVELRHDPEFKIREKDVVAKNDAAIKKLSWSDIDKQLNLSSRSYANPFNWFNGQAGKPDQGPPTKEIEQRMEARAQEFMRFHLTNGDTPDIAKAKAIGDTSRALGYSRAAGPRTYLMPYPPERNYPPLFPMPADATGRPKDVDQLTPQEHSDRYGYIMDQATETARDVAKRIGFKDWAKIGARDLTIVPDGGNTMRDVDAGVAPRYSIFFRGPSGLEKLATNFRANPELAIYKRLGTEAAMEHTDVDARSARKPAPPQQPMYPN